MSVVLSTCVASVGIRAACVTREAAVFESRGDKADGDYGRWWGGSGGGGVLS